MTAITLSGVSKSFADTVALVRIDLHVSSGAFFFLFGPSGCGKTTLLRIIAGLESPTAGAVLFEDRDVTMLPPQERSIGFVFQNYALWPHMTVLENIRFPLIHRGYSAQDAHQRCERVIELTQIGSLTRRYPHELSGGQQQRVAIARALAPEPTILLMDEPLSNLDFRLRESIHSELRELHHSLGLTVVYVTHEFDDARTLATEVAVLNEGQLIESGTPEVLYSTPRAHLTARVTGPVECIPGAYIGEAESVWCRPEQILVIPSAESSLSIGEEQYRHGVCYLAVTSESGERVCTARVEGAMGLHRGARVSLSVPREHRLPVKSEA